LTVGLADGLTHDLLFEQPGLDLALRFHPKQICNKVIGALLFVRVGGGLRLGGDPHVAPALAALSLVYAAARSSVAFVKRSRSSTALPPY
jgi:hypothetical protein